MGPGKTRFKFLLAIGSSCVLSVAANTNVQHNPVHFGVSWEVGRVEKGLFQNVKIISEIEDEWLDHAGLYIVKSMTLNDRWNISAGIGGTFLYRKPEKGFRGAGFFQQQSKGFWGGPFGEVGYSFGDVEKPFFKAALGAFNYKYNQDAKNLGEYLFRSQPYPSLIWTGGYNIVNNASSNLQGLKGQFDWDLMKLDVFLLTETTWAPLYDFSLASVWSMDLGKGFLSLGAGFNYKRLIPVKPSRTQRTGASAVNNAYFEFENQFYYADENYYGSQIALTNSADSAQLTATKTLVSKLVRYYRASERGENTPADSTPNMQFFSSAGLVLMGRASLDIKKILPTDFLGEEDLKFFVEASLLGLKNYDMFYTDPMQRVPIMVGFNFPCFKLFNVLSLQLEYFDSPYLNNAYMIGASNSNVPYFPNSNDAVSENRYLDITDSKTKWSVYINKKINRFSISAQFSRDHMFHPGSFNFFGPQFDSQEITAGKDHWYWAVQMGVGI